MGAQKPTRVENRHLNYDDVVVSVVLFSMSPEQMSAEWSLVGLKKIISVVFLSIANFWPRQFINQRINFRYRKKEELRRNVYHFGADTDEMRTLFTFDVRLIACHYNNFIKIILFREILALGHLPTRLRD